MKGLKKRKKELAIGLVFLVVIILLVVFLLVNNGSKKENDKKKDDNPQNDVVDKGHKVEEKDIVESYGVSKEDAIKMVKTLFNSDTFEFSATITSDGKYEVTVTNTLSNTTYKYLVDPVSKSYYEVK